MIAIKSIKELPEHCYDCPCMNNESGYCNADEKNRTSDWRPFWCPLEEVETEEERIIKQLNEAPIVMQASAVKQVVYCKDCEFRYTSTCFSRHETAEEDFCSNGVKIKKEG